MQPLSGSELHLNMCLASTTTTHCIIDALHTHIGLIYLVSRQYGNHGNAFIGLALYVFDAGHDFTNQRFVARNLQCALADVLLQP